jgi:hypothetical protein
MRNELIERVARAIADKRNELIGLPPAWWGDGEWNGTDLVLTPNDRDRYRAEAAAALAAYDTDDRIKELREALKLACSWAKIDLTRRNTVVAAGIAAILDGEGDSPKAHNARDLVAQAALKGDA